MTVLTVLPDEIRFCLHRRRFALFTVVTGASTETATVLSWGIDGSDTEPPPCHRSKSSKMKMLNRDTCVSVPLLFHRFGRSFESHLWKYQRIAR